MPIIKRLGKLKFEKYTWASVSGAGRRMYFSAKMIREGVAFSLEVENYPWMDGYPARRRSDGRGTWMLSQASVEEQELIPIELTHAANSPDLRCPFAREPDGQLWAYQHCAYFTADPQGLDPEDVRALLNVEANKRRLTLEKAHALQAMTNQLDKPKRRETIPQTVRVEVWQRDGGHCVECNSQEKLEFDHVIPVAMGGGNTSRNLQLLCETCNRRKGASLG